MKIKKIRWDRHPSRPITRGFIDDKLIAMIIEYPAANDDNSGYVHFIKFYEDRWDTKGKIPQSHENVDDAKLYVQAKFEEFVLCCIEK